MIIIIDQLKIFNHLENPHIDLKINIITNKNADRRVYNKPTADEVAIIIPNFGESDKPTSRDALVFEKNGQVKIVNTNHAAYDPLMYPLMFPSGQLGWSPNTILLNSIKDDLDKTPIQSDVFSELSDEADDIATLLEQDAISEDQQLLNNVQDVEGNGPVNDTVQQPTQTETNDQNCTKKMKYVSAMQYYAYLLCDRPGNFLFYFGRLFHQFIVDQFAKIELGRLNFFRHNQDKIRAEKYINIANANSEKSGKSIGTRIVLPSTFKGSPRNLQQLYQDGMAVIRSHGKPDLFITVTCNPLWEEITQELEGIQNSQKLTIIARVFNLKLKAILEDIFIKKIFGNVQAHMYVIEFQKRGLPHAHILVILSEDSKPQNTDDFDNIISAEIPDPKTHPATYATITKCMIHGPCGILNPKSPCMVDGVCSKNFPKDFCEETQENKDGYPEYRRRENGHSFKVTINNNQKQTEIEVDNRWIVPYNPYLSTKYNCHINVEICSSVI